MKEKIELVVLDLAGTTVRDDDAVNRCLAEALAAGGFTITRDDINTVMGLPKPIAIRMLIAGRLGREAAADLVARVHEDFLDRIGRFYGTSPNVAEMPGAADLFRQLRAAGIRVALDTGFSRPTVRALLARLGWTEGTVIDTCVASDEVANGRPYPDMIFEAMRRTGCHACHAGGEGGGHAVGSAGRHCCRLPVRDWHHPWHPYPRRVASPPPHAPDCVTGGIASPASPDRVLIPPRLI